MLDLLNYSPSDLLMFSPRVYYRLIALYNEAVAPAQAAGLGLGLAVLITMMRGSGAARVALVCISVAWLWTSSAFLWERFATINWPVAYIAPVTFVFGALLLLIAVFAPQRLSLPSRHNAATAAALALFAAVLVGYPLIAPLLDRPLTAAEIFGLMPDPTAIATLAMLAAVSGGLRWVLMIVPALWCLISSATLWTLGAPDYFVPVGGALLAAAAAIAAALTRPAPRAALSR